MPPRLKGLRVQAINLGFKAVINLVTFTCLYKDPYKHGGSHHRKKVFLRDNLGSEWVPYEKNLWS